MLRPRGIVLDMEGVIHVDWQPLPGAGETVTQLRETGAELAILTNTTGKTRETIAERLAAMGVEFEPAQIVTAAWAAAEHLRTGHTGRRVYALVEAGATADLGGIDLVDRPEEAEVILLGGPDSSWTYERLNGVFRALLAGVPLVAMQRNRWWPTVSGPSLDAGAFVAGLEYAAGTSAHVVGKPSEEIYRLACALVGAEPAAALMVGDDLESDLAPAAAVGMATCLVRTGKGASFAHQAPVDLDLPALADLPGALVD